MTVEIRPLAVDDDRRTSRSGDEALDLFFHRYAGQTSFASGADQRQPSVMPPAPTYGITAATSRGLEPDLNRSYLDFAVHAGTAVVPARVAKPRDKAKVETAVQVDMAGMRTEGCLAGQEENVDAGGSERSEWALSSSSHISL